MDELVAVDTTGCVCSVCSSGQYVPLEKATGKDILGVVLGRIVNRTEYSNRELAEKYLPEIAFLMGN